MRSMASADLEDVDFASVGGLEVVFEVGNFSAQVCCARLGVRVELGFEAFYLTLDYGQAGRGGGHDALAEGCNEAQCFLECVRGIKAAFALDYQRALDPGA
jgi:hypothetical protein